jgi:Histone RNA hairpin-binding protein RNA-binding domain
MKRSRADYDADQEATARSAFNAASAVVPALLSQKPSAILTDPAAAKAQGAYITSIVASMAESGASVYSNAKAAEAAAAAQKSGPGPAGGGAPNNAGGPRGIFPRGAFGGQPASVIAARQAMEKEVEVDEHTVRKRTEQLELGKNTLGYMRYCLAFPNKQSRGTGRDRPRTPDPTEKMSKRRWDSVIRSWRRQLHSYDLPTPMGAILSGNFGGQPQPQQQQYGGGSGGGHQGRGPHQQQQQQREAAIPEEDGGEDGAESGGGGAGEGALDPLPESIKKGPVGQGIGYVAKDMPQSGVDFLGVMWGNDYREKLRQRGYDERGQLIIPSAAVVPAAGSSTSSSAAGKRESTAPAAAASTSGASASSGAATAAAVKMPQSRGVFVSSKAVEGLLSEYLKS